MTASPEIHLIIIGNLNLLDRICLKLTNRYFHRTIAPLNSNNIARAQDLLYLLRGKHHQSIPGRERKQNDLPRPYLACLSCQRLRSSSNFADNELRTTPALRLGSRRTLWRKGLSSRLKKRLCIECGLKKRQRGYGRGTMIEVEEFSYVYCKHCCELREVIDGTEFHTGLCRECLLEKEKQQGLGRGSKERVR